MTPTPYDCREAFRRLDDYLDREWSGAEMEAVRVHLLDCAVCAREFDFEAAWIRSVREKVQRIDVAEDLRARIRRALDRGAPPASRRRQDGADPGTPDPSGR